ncbi:TPM domain-containing protein [Psychroflexus sediminis]|uniref:TLP18.3, Psb32 and MOLO-1 founding protein of phosphatase n=1 Tax=Psychroflexus sediminis TaxID=470826 RepID=A0A1G7VW67_9FLAO|nr:TPM domain-containing protein [Psychroflexus sediminis]SDG63689.1 TLP18.3, Psb32 and MOLO-1 founding protein of phosphatase [Psychroflexus sediminis]
MKVSEFINPAEEHDIVEAIKEAELNTSGEIRVHIEHKCPKDRFERALEIFEKLEMHKTELSNGVLIYVAIDDHQLVILGDKGINEVVPKGFWESTRDEILSQFKHQHFKRGLVNGILEAGKQLKQHFPYQSDDTNELDNEISKG